MGEYERAPLELLFLEQDLDAAQTHDDDDDGSLAGGWLARALLRRETEAWTRRHVSLVVTLGETIPYRARDTHTRRGHMQTTLSRERSVGREGRLVGRSGARSLEEGSHFCVLATRS